MNGIAGTWDKYFVSEIWLLGLHPDNKYKIKIYNWGDKLKQTSVTTASAVTHALIYHAPPDNHHHCNYNHNSCYHFQWYYPLVQLDIQTERQTFFWRLGRDNQRWWTDSKCIHCTYTKLVSTCVKPLDGKRAFWYWWCVDSVPWWLDVSLDVVANDWWTTVILRSIPRQLAQSVGHLTQPQVLRCTWQLYTNTDDENTYRPIFGYESI